MSSFNKFDLSIRESFPKTLVSISVRQELTPSCLDLNNCLGFSFTVEIDDEFIIDNAIGTPENTTITTEEAKRRAFKKAIETIQNFALSEGLSI